MVSPTGDHRSLFVVPVALYERRTLFHHGVHAALRSSREQGMFTIKNGQTREGTRA